MRDDLWRQRVLRGAAAEVSRSKEKVAEWERESWRRAQENLLVAGWDRLSDDQSAAIHAQSIVRAGCVALRFSRMNDLRLVAAKIFGVCSLEPVFDIVCVMLSTMACLSGESHIVHGKMPPFWKRGDSRPTSVLLGFACASSGVAKKLVIFRRL